MLNMCHFIIAFISVVTDFHISFGTFNFRAFVQTHILVIGVKRLVMRWWEWLVQRLHKHALSRFRICIKVRCMLQEISQNTRNCIRIACWMTVNVFTIAEVYFRERELMVNFAGRNVHELAPPLNRSNANHARG